MPETPQIHSSPEKATRKLSSTQPKRKKAVSTKREKVLKIEEMMKMKKKMEKKMHEKML